MKNIILIFAFLITTSLSAQLHAGDSKDHWERNTYEKWDDFNPWGLFGWFWAPYKNYKKDDKRLIYAYSGMMHLWGVYADEWQMHERSVDSIFKQETYKAVDRKLSKNYLLLQRPLVMDTYDKIENKLQNFDEKGIPESLSDIVRNRAEGIMYNIEFLQNSDSPDSEKFEMIASEIDDLNKALEMAGSIEALALSFLTDELESLKYDLSDAIELNILEIEALIIE